MTKRQAAEQITKDAFDDDYETNEADAPARATSETLSKRKILKPRGKLNEPKGESPFSTASQFPKPHTTLPNSPTTTTSQKTNKIRALNENFVKKVNESHIANSIVDFTSIAEAYVRYYKSIESDTKEIPAEKIEQTKDGHDDAESEEESEEEPRKPEVKIQGPSFSFSNTSSTTSKPAFTFDPKKIAKLNERDPDDSDDELKGPTFNFSKPIVDSVFKFKPNGADTNNDTAKGGTEKSSPFQFPALSKPSVANTFGGLPQQPESNAPPKFNFSANPPSSSAFNTANTFQFGSAKPTAFTKATAQPTSSPFSFGKPAGENTTASPFSFGTSQKPASFGSTNQADANPFSAPTKSTSTVAEPEDNKAGEDEPEVEGNFTPVAEMGEMKQVETGEENEETKYTIKAKLMEFDQSNKNEPYTPKGVGLLKVLRNKDTGKSRILIRAEGNFRVLLNTTISKDIEYTRYGHGSLIRLPVFSPEGKITTYCIRVKDATGGQELLKQINDAKC
ncbi:uncharacterized protein LODBEIA_P57540 [Lodderomyces beijingensis]|uniref:RanBD1 domain-containing protein n=1 Tax=Lodderomyces beijingensis TaxID=1775926 RepID=A0ABP0ZRI9_9ASCO